MLQQFSWGYFLLAAVVLNLVWYGFVVLFFYRKELSGLFGAEHHPAYAKGPGASDGREPEPGSAEAARERAISETAESLMGPSRLPIGVELLSSSQVSFSAGDQNGRYDQVGLVADVVAELKVIFAELDASGGEKGEFLRRMGQLREDFGGLSGHPSLGAIKGFIRERALFPVSDTELDELW